MMLVYLSAPLLGNEMDHRLDQPRALLSDNHIKSRISRDEWGDRFHYGGARLIKFAKLGLLLLLAITTIIYLKKHHDFYEDLEVASLQSTDAN